jgi:hypothetical protein
VIVGALALGLLHGLFSRWLDRAADRSPTKALFYLGMVAWTLLWAENLTHIEHTRSIIVHAVAGIVLYALVLRWFLREHQPYYAQPQDEYGLSGVHGYDQAGSS